ncbi:hypothetical protein C0989_002338 [Termitomyces sp. Mn162]|nr:hypothetical protein C0989_002338 [Termitomyces sp. Mn162]
MDNSTMTPSPETSTALAVILGRRQTRQLHVFSRKVNEEIGASPRGPTIPRSPAADSKAAGTIPLVPTPTQHTGHLTPSRKRKPTVITFVKDMDTVFSPKTSNSTPSERVLVHSDCEDSTRSFLSHLNLLRAKRSKLRHCASSPHLASPHLTSKPPLSLPGQNKTQEHAALKKKRSSPFRKEPRTPSTSREY